MPQAGPTAGAMLLLAILTLLSLGAAAQSMNDPRNESDAYYDALNGAACYFCHASEGFSAGRITFPRLFQELPVDTPTNITLRYIHDSGNGQTMQNIRAVVDTSRAENVRVLTPDAPQDLHAMIEDTLDASTTHVERVELGQNVNDVYVSVSAAPSELPLTTGQRLDVQLQAPEQVDPIPFDGTARHQYVALDADAIMAGGFGPYRVNIRWNDPSGLEPQTDLRVEMFVNQTQVASEFTFAAPPETRLQPGETLDIDVPIVFTEPGMAELDFRVESISYHTHQSGDSAPRDDGLFWRFATMRIEGGDQLVLSQGATGPVPVGAAVDLHSLFARIVGFTTLILVPVALLSGGVFGKASRRWMNGITGGAKRRVLWHGAMSWMIIAMASLHFVLALLESRFVWTKGLLWGGLGWGLLVSLGFTGYYQVRMIKRWSYRTWRHTHLWSAVAVFGFGLSHMLLDGSSLGAVRQWLGGWLDLLIWP